MKVRIAQESDISAITEIYNEAILTTTATFDTEPKTLDDRKKWFRSRGERHPVFVCEVDGIIAGWGSLSEWSDRSAYANTAENSLYIQENYRGKGIGKLLMAALIEGAQARGIHTLVARIAGENSVSVKLHTDFGFLSVGTLKEVGRKFDRWLDVTMMQKIF